MIIFQSHVVVVDFKCLVEVILKLEVFQENTIHADII